MAAAGGLPPPKSGIAGNMFSGTTRAMFGGAADLNGAGSCSANRGRFDPPDTLPLPMSLSPGNGPTMGLKEARSLAVTRRDRGKCRNHAGPLPPGTGSPGGSPTAAIGNGSPTAAIGNSPMSPTAFGSLGLTGGAGSALAGGGMFDNATTMPGGGFPRSLTPPPHQGNALGDAAFASEMAALEQTISLLGEQLRKEAVHRAMASNGPVAGTVA